jgi:acyl-CoA thioesterase-1
VPIVNAGRIGDTTGDALNRLDSAVLSRNPKIVIVFLGGNDVLQSVPVPQRVSNITTIAQRIRQRGAAVILVDLGSGVLDAFGGALPGIAAQTTSRYVPGVLEGVFGVPSLMNADGIHPNDAGHAIIADRIEPALRAEIAAAG